MADSTAIAHAEGVFRTVHGLPSIDRQLRHEAPITQSWTRCVNDHRLDPSKLHAPTVIGSADLKDRQTQHEDLMQIAVAEMDSLYDQISGSGHALLMTDASGVILCERVDPTLRKMFRSAGILIGADWSENREGTNGVGTCIAENRPVTVHRADHFRARHIGLSCTGAPIRDPGGSLVAVLDVSSISSHDTRAGRTHTMALVNLSANFIEKCLFLRRQRNHTILRFHSRPELVNLLYDGALALSQDGTVIAADDTAVRLLGANSRLNLLGRPLAEIFDVRPEDLLAGSRNHPAIWPLRDLRRGRRYFVSLREPQREPARDGGAKPALEPAMLQPRKNALSLDDLAGEDPQMLRNVHNARRIADSMVSVLIQGPTGSGKEVFARALHRASSRAQRNFVAVNCAAIPETLIESELFGYKSGAFTGAHKDGMRGKVLQASGGTLFLDEVGDMPLLLQTRLLRVLEDNEVVPLGSEKPIKVDIRVISASHRNLREMIAKGQFREDLYYRLNGIKIELPALAERADRNRLIREVFAIEAAGEAHAAVEAKALQCLLNYQWPGTVRELRNVIRAALAICEGGLVTRLDLPRELCEAAPPAAAAPAAPGAPLANMATPAETSAGNPLEVAEREALLAVIDANRWNMRLTAQQLGMSRNTLYRRLKRLRIGVGLERVDQI
ncbi:sigma-54-dependent Fis family transcriptional regulator [Hydrocarboniphaga effusa]|uniref:sigma-54-dependent Fis family transcriptional regulator n=1 Tax=Hydrocarboniphaga effusa TaxID=243629 RepID=UPI00398C00FA